MTPTPAETIQEVLNVIKNMPIPLHKKYFSEQLYKELESLLEEVKTNTK